MPRVAALIAGLRLQPHPEGGFYREWYRDPVRTGRGAVTCIDFLLPAGAFSAFHRVAQAELWHLLEGGPLELHLLSAGGHQKVVLGHRVEAGETLQAAVPAGVWQAAAPVGEYALCGCTVAPAFDFADFELATREGLTREFPEHAELVARFTRR